jgi:hypothetical protein
LFYVFYRLMFSDFILKKVKKLSVTNSIQRF